MQNGKNKQKKINESPAPSFSSAEDVSAFRPFKLWE